MALILKDRVRESTVTAGTGTITLDGAVSGFQSFLVIGNTNTTYYAIVDVTTGAWEVGVGTYSTTGPTLTRDSVLESSIGGGKVDFTSNIKDVFCTYPAEQAVTLNDIQTLTNKTINLSSNTLVATSAQIAAAVTDETGTGALVFANAPTFVAPALGTPSSGVLTNATGLPISTGVSGLGTGVATALAVNVGSAGAPVVNGGALGTPASGVVTNLTGTASININGTVGSTTPATGSFTSLTDSGNLAFTGTGNRITGDFSNATIANRVMFQTSTTNGNTLVSAIPNGTGGNGVFQAENNSDPTNASFIRIQAGGDSSTIQSGRNGSGSFQPLGIFTGGSERVRIDTSGNVGIGTSSPQTRLVVSNGSNENLEVTPGNVALNGCVFQYINRTTTTTRPDLNYYLSGTGVHKFYTNDLERMRITSAGNVGIGTDAAASRLSVASDSETLRFTPASGVSSTASTFGTFRSNAGIFYFGLDSSTGGSFSAPNAAVLWHSGAPMIFATNNVERMRIDTNGNLLVGTTSNANATKLNVLANGVHAAVTTEAPVSSTYTHIFFRNTNGNVGEIQTNGSLTSFLTFSDYRLKHDIQPMEGALAKVAALKPVTYKWNANDSNGEGFIAHELQEVCPSAVSGEKDAVETYTDEDGVEQTRIKPQGIDTSFLTATLAAAIQEQQAIIESLRARLDAANI